MSTTQKSKRIHIYINYNEKTNNPPKLWAGNDFGDLFYGSIKRRLTYESKSADYFARTWERKVRDNYHHLGSYEISVLNDLSPLAALFDSREPPDAIRTMRTNVELNRLANKMVINDFNKQVTARLALSLAKHGLKGTNPAAASQQSSQAPKIVTPRINVSNVLISKPADQLANTAWNW